MRSINRTLPIMPQSRLAAVTLHDSYLAAHVSILDHIVSVDDNATFRSYFAVDVLPYKSGDVNYPTKDAIMVDADTTNKALASAVVSGSSFF
jgi:hypothetical protein